MSVDESVLAGFTPTIHSFFLFFGCGFSSGYGMLQQMNPRTRMLYPIKFFLMSLILSMPFLLTHTSKWNELLHSIHKKFSLTELEPHSVRKMSVFGYGMVWDGMHCEVRCFQRRISSISES